MAAMAAQLNTLPWIYPNIVYRIIPWIWKGSDYFITRPVKFFFVFFFRQKESLGALTCWAVHHSPPSVAVACQSLSIREWFLGVLIKWRVFDVLNWRSPSLIRLDHSRCPSRWLGSVAKTWPLLFSCGTLPPWPVTCLEVVLSPCGDMLRPHPHMSLARQLNRFTVVCQVAAIGAGIMCKITQYKCKIGIQ